MHNNFKYLDDLIHSGAKEIVLDSDIVLGYDEKSRYEDGIKLDVDDLIIDGNGHSIDAKGQARIFYCTGKYITIKNAVFANGCCGGGGAICNYEGELTIMSSEFLDNSSDRYLKGGGAIYNWAGRITVIKSTFTNNMASGDREIYGGAIGSRDGKIIIKKSLFKNNRVTGKYDINGGAVGNDGGIMKLLDVEFEGNKVHSLNNDIYNNGVFISDGKSSSPPLIVNEGKFIASDEAGDIDNSGQIIELKSLEETQRDFTYLNELIQRDIREIKLEYDIMLDVLNDEDERFEDGIRVERNDLVIDGGGHTIDAGCLTRIFQCSGKNIQLKNVTLKNGVSTKIGGAIFNDGELTLIHSTIAQNVSWNCGGAIHNEGKLTIKESSLQDNKSGKVNGRGGAVFNNGELKVLQSIFANNESNGSLEACGGAIYSCAKLDMVESEFTENYAETAGGAIFSSDKLNIVECKLNDNVSHSLGGAIYNGKAELNIHKSEISANESRGGGAIYSYDGMIEIIESMFSKNECRGDGGAILNDSGQLTIAKSAFEDNGATQYGGAIYNKGGKLIVKDSMLSENGLSGASYTDGYGGAIRNNGEADITECKFSENIAHYGGAIDNAGKLAISQSTFDKNRADFGGAMRDSSDFSAEINNCEFRKNIAKKDAAAIYNWHGTLNVFNCEISHNESPEDIIVNLELLEIQNSNINNNKSKHVIWSGIVWNENVSKRTRFNHPDADLHISNCSFMENDAGEAVLCNNAKVCIVNLSVFENSPSSLNIENNNDLTLINTEISDDGKTVLNNGHVLLKESSPDFEAKICGKGTVEIAEKNPKNYDFGYLDKMIHERGNNVIVLNHDISFERYEYEEYKNGIKLDVDDLLVDGRGHSIDGLEKTRMFIVTGKNVTLKNIVFKNGHPIANRECPQNVGGALMIMPGAGLTIKNCKFTNNGAKSGGVIDNNGELTLAKSVFDANMARIYGGAINNECKLKVLDSIFVKNTVTSEVMLKYPGGGAINNTGEMKMIKTTIKDNAARYGGGIKNLRKLDVSKSTFNENYAKENGGAIFNDGDLNVVESGFSGNASSDGQTIFNGEEGKATVIRSKLDAEYVEFDESDALAEEDDNDVKTLGLEALFK